MSPSSSQLAEDFEVNEQIVPKKILPMRPMLTATSLGAKKILIIDDDPDLRLGLHIRLKANYYDTCFAGDAESAIQVAAAQQPDLIILDLGLPDRDGYAVIEQLNRFPQLADLPIIVVTGRDRFTHEKRARDAGAKRFFVKPIDNYILLRGIEELLR